MTSGRNERLADVSAEALQAWLTDGILSMSGLGDDASEAFEPYAGHIGCSREFAWIDELITFALGLDSESRHAFDRAAVAALQALAQGDVARLWPAVFQLLDLIRHIRARGPGPALATLLANLSDGAKGLDTGARKQLLAAVLLTACETEGQDRLEARETALNAARQLVEGEAALEPRATAKLLRRLSPFEFSASELASVGVNPAEVNADKQRAIFKLLKHGRSPADADA